MVKTIGMATLADKGAPNRSIGLPNESKIKGSGAVVGAEVCMETGRASVYRTILVGVGPPPNGVVSQNINLPLLHPDPVQVVPLLDEQIITRAGRVVAVFLATEISVTKPLVWARRRIVVTNSLSDGMATVARIATIATVITISISVNPLFR